MRPVKQLVSFSLSVEMCEIKDCSANHKAVQWVFFNCHIFLKSHASTAAYTCIYMRNFRHHIKIDSGAKISIHAY